MGISDKQKEIYTLIANHRFSLIYGGSRTGKTYLIVSAIIIRALKYPNTRHFICRNTFANVKQHIFEDTFPEVMRDLFPTVEPVINKQVCSYKFENGAVIRCVGLDEKRVDKILGSQADTIFFNEATDISSETYTTVVTRSKPKPGVPGKFIVDENPTTKAYWTYRRFIEHKNLETGEDYDYDKFPNLKAGSMHIDWTANPTYTQEYMDILVNELPYYKRQRFLVGKHMDEDSTVQLVLNEWINYLYGDFKRKNYIISIGVDPAGTTNKNSDNTGIVVAGKNKHDKKIVILEDLSGHYKPEEWAKLVINKRKEWNASRIIVETNMGHDLCERNLTAVDPSVKRYLETVHASKSKEQRFEHLSIMYENSSIIHRETFRELEEELVTWRPGGKSPDRIDAMNYAVEYLKKLEPPKEYFVIGGK